MINKVVVAVRYLSVSYISLGELSTVADHTKNTELIRVTEANPETVSVLDQLVTSHSESKPEQ